MKLLSLLPLRVHYLLSDFNCFLVSKVFRYRRSVVKRNLHRCFPDLGSEEIAKITGEYYHYICDIIAENIWSLSMDNREFHRRFHAVNPELMDELFRNHSKVVVMTAHRGNWELMGGYCGYWEDRAPDSFGWQPMWLGYKRTRNKVINDLVIAIRNHEYAHIHANGRLIESHNFLRTILKKDNGGMYVFIADQSPKDARTITKFMGVPTLMFNGAAHLACKLNLPIVYLDIAHPQRGEYAMTFTLIDEFPKGADPDEITRQYAALLEESIKANPHNWLWSHKRWKREPTEQEWETYNSLYNDSTGQQQPQEA